MQKPFVEFSVANGIERITFASYSDREIDQCVAKQQSLGYQWVSFEVRRNKQYVTFERKQIA
jgi:hypothetical protein